ncbi:hypothetical protein M3661_08475 [Paenibacillus sp. MER 180]|uniref:hypothetical protein n=1 Tax=Paenibacillus sp. MER 180 TaxID=2939570 RepID=UPI00203A9184|nr:hypothetical protein [Paenibacillus sp. MER 180]MCM3290161.1 hypothetical protein [Paenibacillus sp. MER 180]
MIKQFNKKSYRLSILGLAMILTLSSVSLVNAKEGNAASALQKDSVQKQDPQAAVNNEPGTVYLDDTYIVYMYTIDPKTAKKQTGYVYEPAIEKVKKESPETAYSFLSWRVKDKEITIQSNTMSKEDLIKLAKTMVKK